MAELLNQSQLVAYLHDELGIRLCTKTVHRLMAAGMPHDMKFGKRPRFDPKRVSDWITRHNSRTSDTPNTLRQIKLAMKECRCEVCGWGASRETLDDLFSKRMTPVEMHHIIPARKQGRDDPSNLIALCPTCHWIADRLTTYGEKHGVDPHNRESLVCGISEMREIFRGDNERPSTSRQTA